MAGDLVAHMPSEVAGIFLRIDQGFWSVARSGLRVDGMLFDVQAGCLIPDEIDEDRFCVFEECARSWLALKDIGEDNLAFPTSLLSVARGTQRQYGKRPSRIEQWCVDTGLAILTERGGLSPNFKQTHLIREIYSQRPAHWGDEEPSEASMKRYARKAIQQFTDQIRR